MQPSILILASRYDFSIDYVISILRSKGEVYLRLNKEDISDYELCFDPINEIITGEFNGSNIVIYTNKLKSIWYRRPIYFRVPSQVNPYQRFIDNQWLSFIQGLMISEECRWMNYPQSTYKAENKIVQLNTASKIGFNIPSTVISNSESVKSVYNVKDIAIKGLDTVHVQSGSHQIFGYTNIVSLDEIQSESIKSAPVVFQEYLENKLDIRVTVVGDEVFAVSVTDYNKQAIKGDWRLKKNETLFHKYRLPSDISDMCVKMTKCMGLSFGALDLAYCDGIYYFFEINPTGEWAWLVDDASLPIDSAIANYLTG